MSLNHLTSQVVAQPYLNPRVNSLQVDNGLNMSNSAINNVSSINGLPVFDIDPNPVNIIYKPGVPLVQGSNIVNDWKLVVAKANQNNVNECLNVFIDDSVVTPAPITMSLDCNSRVSIFGSSLNSLVPTNCLINDGVVLKNPRMLGYILQFNCQNITQSCIQFDDNFSCLMLNACSIKNTADSILPSIHVPDGNNNYFVFDTNVNIDNSLTPTIGAMSIGTGSGLYLICKNGIAIGFMNAISGGATATLVLGNDGTINPANLTQSLFTGTIINVLLNYAINDSYNDTKLPHLTASNVQDAIDNLKAEVVLNNIPQSILGPLSITNQPTMIVTSSSNQSISTLALFTGWDTILYSNGITQSTPGTFTVSIGGIYNISCSLGVLNNAAATFIAINTPDLAFSFCYAPLISTYGSTNMNTMAKLNSGDNVSIYGFAPTGTTSLGTQIVSPKPIVGSFTMTKVN